MTLEKVFNEYINETTNVPKEVDNNWWEIVDKLDNLLEDDLLNSVEDAVGDLVLAYSLDSFIQGVELTKAFLIDK